MKREGGDMIPTVTYQPPTQAALEAQAVEFFKACRPKQYREMRKSGELAEVAYMRAEATKRQAETLIQSGVHEAQAWQWAIREVILETDPD